MIATISKTPAGFYSVSSPWNDRCLEYCNILQAINCCRRNGWAYQFELPQFDCVSQFGELAGIWN